MENLTINETAPEAASEEEDENNPFSILPDELIISHILERLTEVKCLCVFSAVSKRLHSLVLICRKVSFAVPLAPESPPRSLALKLLCSPLDFIKQLINIRAGPHEPPFPWGENFLASRYCRFLGNLKSVHYLNGEVSFPPNFQVLDDDTWIKWLLDYKYPNSWSFIGLTAKSITDELDEDENIPHHSTSLASVIDDADSRCSLLSKAMRTRGYFPELRRAVISDSRKQGRVVVRSEKLAAMRAHNSNRNGLIGCVKTWNKAVVNLPVSDCVMKGVQLVLVKIRFEGEEESIAEPENDISDYKDEEEMKIVVEAVTEITKDEADTEKPFFVDKDFVNGFPGALL